MFTRAITAESSAASTQFFFFFSFKTHVSWERVTNGEPTLSLHQLLDPARSSPPHKHTLGTDRHTLERITQVRTRVILKVDCDRGGARPMTARATDQDARTVLALYACACQALACDASY